VVAVVIILEKVTLFERIMATNVEKNILNIRDLFEQRIEY
jgi:hypothetical protein